MKCLTGPLANAARLAAALVDVELLAEVARIALCVHVVAQRRAAHLDGHLQNGLHRPREACHFLRLQAARLPLGPDARAKQRLARVDVPHAHHERAVHQQLLDRDFALARDAPEVVRVERIVQRLGRQMRQERVLVRALGGVVQAAESTRIVEAQRYAGVEQHVEVIVRDARRLGRKHAQAARHAEMQQQRSGVELEEDVLRAPPGLADELAFDGGGKGVSARASAGAVHEPRGPRSCGPPRADRLRDGLFRLREARA